MDKPADVAGLQVFLRPVALERVASVGHAVGDIDLNPKPQTLNPTLKSSRLCLIPLAKYWVP